MEIMSVLAYILSPSSFCLRTLGSVPPPAVRDELHSQGEEKRKGKKPFKREVLFFFFFSWIFFFSSFFSFTWSSPQIHLCIPLFISTPTFLFSFFLLLLLLFPSPSWAHPPSSYHQPHLISIPQHSNLCGILFSLSLSPSIYISAFCFPSPFFSFWSV